MHAINSSRSSEVSIEASTAIPDSTNSIHIVRRYGKVGGMEHYVWELTHSLAAAGHRVKVVCENQFHPLEDITGNGSIEILTIGKIWPRKPRWIHMMRFSGHVHRLIRFMDTTQWVIHSHEIIDVHDVTTFHGNSIKSRNRSPLDRFSPRIRAWENFERRELTISDSQRIFPVSPIVASTLADFYPECAGRLEKPAYPGVSARFNNIQRKTNGKVLGFIGVEWKRKGLDILCPVVASLRREDPEISLVVAGCTPDDVSNLFHDWQSGYELMGWVADPLEFFRNIDALVLPARAEPFGMVVAEANAAGIPVVVSSNCGIAEFVTGNRGIVVDINQPHQITTACRSVLAQQHSPDPMGFSWDRTAQQYARVYREVMRDKARLKSQSENQI
jgi:UDP-glucose:(heptosyl)LPS alpha-1,3-glucosyltransferase